MNKTDGAITKLVIDYLNGKITIEFLLLDVRRLIFQELVKEMEDEIISLNLTENPLKEIERLKKG